MERIGFIGLGIMGKPMAGNLLAAGFPLTVYNRSRGTVDELVADGAAAAGSPREAAANSDVVITMLPDSPDVETVVLGPDGVAEGIREGSLYVDMSTIAPATSRQVAAVLSERGVDAVDAPVSGGEPAAQAGELSIMAGGSDEALARARPIFEVLGKATTHIGAAGAGQVAKAANQVVVALTIQAVAEALVLARKAGADPARVRGALLGGFAQSRILEFHGQRMLDGNYEPGFKLALHRKDLAIALQLGREEHAPLFATAQAAELMDALLAQGEGDRDHSALATLYEQLAGVGEHVEAG
ncbi:MAG: 2-hydroxy-3-oxopropionate reductase [Solirubrobacteraceae bacterium]|jgi:2-hydroxy-3-oxopropionate reductase|nr:2-hydroxy-3-oxopropionate reductase [Solirubrobacteraceae bacterium]